MLLNFSDRTRTGVFNMVWPYTSDRAVTTFSHANKNPPNHANAGLIVITPVAIINPCSNIRCHLWKYIDGLSLLLYRCHMQSFMPKWDKRVVLPDGESNPGLLRDRQGSLPLDYRGLDSGHCGHLSPDYNITQVFWLCFLPSPCYSCCQQYLSWIRLDLSPNKNELLRAGFEPATYGFLLCFQLQSTALPTELSKVHVCQS